MFMTRLSMIPGGQALRVFGQPLDFSQLKNTFGCENERLEPENGGLEDEFPNIIKWSLGFFNGCYSLKMNMASGTSPF